MSKLKIACLEPRFPSISETFILNQVTGLIDRGHDVRIISTNRPPVETMHEVVEKYKLMDRVEYLPPRTRNRWIRIIKGLLSFPRYCMRNKRLLRLFKNRRFRRMIFDRRMCALAACLGKKERYDIVHGQYGWLGAKLVKLRMAEVIDLPIMTSFRGSDATVLLRRNPHIYDALFRRGDLFLAVSEFLRDLLIRHGCPEEKIRIHCSGVELEEFKFRETGPPVNERIRILCIARLVEVKGVDYLLRSVKILLNKGYEVQLDIAGDGPLSGEYQSLVDQLRISDDVIFHGYCNRRRISDLFSQSHILAVPSVIGSDGAEEGLPNTIKEAMAVGVPVVATNTGGIPELIEDGVTGFLVPQRDPDALAEKILYMVNNPDLWHDLLLNARLKVEKTMDAEMLNERLERMSREVIEEV